MKHLLGIALIAILLLGGYLLFWPVPISPKAWEAQPNPGYVGDFAANTGLADLEHIPLPDGVHGPEDMVVIQENGREIVYTTSQTGVILRIDPQSQTSEVFAETGGVPLGMERDEQGNFIVADAFRGLLSVTPDGQTVTVLSDEVDGTQILYADDLDIAPDGVIYFSDASTKYGAEANGTTLGASFLEIVEHGKTGRFLAYNPRTGKTRLVADGYSFSNGVAMCPDGTCFLGIETGTYGIDRIYIEGPRQGETERIVDNLPGFPDNINAGLPIDGDPTFWVGLVGPRSTALDDMAAKPFLRSLLFRLPEAWRPAREDYGHVFQIDADGKILQSLQDPAGAYPATTGAIESDDWLYISSLEAHTLARLRKPGRPGEN